MYQSKTAPAGAAQWNGYGGIHHTTATGERPPLMLQAQVWRIASDSSLADVEGATLRLLAIYGAAAMVAALHSVQAEVA